MGKATRRYLVQEQNMLNTFSRTVEEEIAQ